MQKPVAPAGLLLLTLSRCWMADRPLQSAYATRCQVQVCEASSGKSATPWSCVSPDLAAALLAAASTNAKQVAADLADALGLTNYQSDIRQSVRVDLMVAALRFASGQHFHAAQAGSLLGMCQQLLQAAQQQQELAHAQAGVLSHPAQAVISVMFTTACMLAVPRLVYKLWLLMVMIQAKP